MTAGPIGSADHRSAMIAAGRARAYIFRIETAVKPYFCITCATAVSEAIPIFCAAAMLFDF